MSSGEGEQGDIESLQSACTEARYTIDQQIEKIHQEDRKAVGIFRVNLLVLGVLTSGVSFSLRSDDLIATQFLNAHTVIGAGALIFSSVIAAMAYTSSKFKLGVNAEPVEDAVNDSLTHRDFLEKLSEEYSGWLQYNQRVHDFNANAITWAMIFAVSGLVLFLGGIAVGIGQVRGDPISYGLLAADILASIIIGIAVYNSDTIFEKVMEIT
jgi:hypothetical protein